MKLKAGNEVRLKSPEKYWDNKICPQYGLKFGEVYTIDSIEEDGIILHLVGYPDINGWFPERFELVEEKEEMGQTIVVKEQTTKEMKIWGGKYTHTVILKGTLDAVASFTSLKLAESFVENAPYTPYTYEIREVA